MATRISTAGALMWRKPLLYLLSLWFLLSHTRSFSEAYIGPDGLCRIHLFAPFTTANNTPALGLRNNPNITLGFSGLVAAQLAVDDFNARNASKVPELADISDSCTVQLELERVYDTGSISHQAAENWIRDVAVTNQVDVPCAIAGPHHDLPALDMSIQASSFRIPLVTSRTYALSISTNYFSPFTTTVHPDMLTSAEVLVSYLQYRNRTNFIALVHPTSQTGIQRREALGYYLDAANIQWISSGYSPGDGDLLPGTNSYEKAMAKVKASGYRTIVIAMDDVFQSLRGLADAAEAYQLNNGDYFYAFNDIFESSALQQDDNENMLKLALGSVFVVPLTQIYLDIATGPLEKGWTQQGADFAARVNRLNPIAPGEPGYLYANDGYFQANETNFPEYSTEFVYDSVMSIGMGACNAKRQPDGSIDGADHHEGIDQSSFYGSTGRVEFGHTIEGRSGARRPGTVWWTAVNVVHEGYLTPDFLIPDYGGVWTSNFTDGGSFTPDQFQYANNQTEPPALLRDLPDQNHLSKPLRVLGLAVMFFVIVFGLVAWVWVWLGRKHRVFAASQPFFLYWICFGNIVQSLAVLPLSFDESDGLTTTQLDRMCVTLPWFLVVGYLLVYGSLFTKLWRVHKVLQFSRRQVKIRHVAKPMALIFILALSLLVLWTILSPLRWERFVVDEDTGASVGSCEADHESRFVAPMVILVFITTCMTMLMAYKTRDVDEAYSDSWWIFVMIMVQIEVMIVAIPVVALLGEESPDANYLGYAVIVLSFPVSCLLFIMLPKLYIHTQALLGRDNTNGPKRGERGNGRVSGVKQKTAALHSSGSSQKRIPVTLPPFPSNTGNYDDNDRSSNSAFHASMIQEHRPDGMGGSGVVARWSYGGEDRLEKGQRPPIAVRSASESAIPRQTRMLDSETTQQESKQSFVLDTVVDEEEITTDGDTKDQDEIKESDHEGLGSQRQSGSTSNQMDETKKYEGNLLDPNMTVQTEDNQDEAVESFVNE